MRCTASSLLRKNVKSINRFVWLHLFDALKKRCYISPHNLHNHLLGCICPMHFSFVATAFFISHSPLNICCICTMHFSFVATHLHSFLNYAAKVASARCTLALLRPLPGIFTPKRFLVASARCTLAYLQHFNQCHSPAATSLPSRNLFSSSSPSKFTSTAAPRARDACKGRVDVAIGLG